MSANTQLFSTKRGPRGLRVQPPTSLRFFDVSATLFALPKPRAVKPQLHSLLRHPFLLESAVRMLSTHSAQICFKLNAVPSLLSTSFNFSYIPGPARPSTQPPPPLQHGCLEMGEPFLDRPTPHARRTESPRSPRVWCVSCDVMLGKGKALPPL